MGKAPKKAGISKRRASSTTTAAAPRAPKGGVVLIVALRARPGREAELEKELRALVAPTRAERGCLAYDLHASSGQPGLFLQREIWRSLAHHQKHWETPHMKRWNEGKRTLLASREASFWKQIA